MEKRIYYHDTDAGGVVYYGNYLKYLEEARTEFLEKTGLSVTKLHEQGFFFAVRKCSVTYKSPARYGDTVICDAKLIKLSAAQIFMEQTIHHKASGRLLIEAEVSLVCLSKDFKPQEVPQELREKLTP